MSEIRATLERIERRVPMPEPAMERMLRRRERKQRNERITAAVVGLGVAAAGIAGAALTLRVAGGTRPASGGGGEAASAEGGALVLPTVAIWTAIVVLGLTVLATLRLRARFADADVEREGREPGGAAASARRPAAAPGTAPWKGGSEMDSKPRTGVGIPRTEMPAIRFDDGKVRRTNRWLAGAVVVLALAVVALGAALIAQSGGETTPGQKTPPLAVEVPASSEVVEAVDASADALNAGDGAALAAIYADDAVVTDTVAGLEFEGADAIVARYTGPLYEGFELQRTGQVIQIGDFAAHAFTYSPSTMMDSGGSGFLVFQLDGDLKIQHQWIMGF